MNSSSVANSNNEQIAVYSPAVALKQGKVIAIVNSANHKDFTPPRSVHVLRQACLHSNGSHAALLCEHCPGSCEALRGLDLASIAS